MFRHHQRLRRWAAGVLLLWLFSVGLGVANACLAPGPVQSGNPSAAHAADAGTPHEGGHGESDSALESNCVDFCDKASVSTLPLQTAPDDVPGHALLPAAVALAYPVPDHVPIRPQVPRQDGVPAPPIHIAFLRLTL